MLAPGYPVLRAIYGGFVVSKMVSLIALALAPQTRKKRRAQRPWKRMAVDNCLQTFQVKKVHVFVAMISLDFAFRTKYHAVQELWLLTACLGRRSLRGSAKSARGGRTVPVPRHAMARNPEISLQI